MSDDDGGNAYNDDMGDDYNDDELMPEEEEEEVLDDMVVIGDDASGQNSRLDDASGGADFVFINPMADNGGAPEEAAPGAAGLSIDRRERTTTRYLTKYERARVLGTRALQLSLNAPPMVELEGETDPLQIASKELREGKIPLIIRRFLPDGSFEDWALDELIID